MCIYTYICMYSNVIYMMYSNAMRRSNQPYMQLYMRITYTYIHHIRKHIYRRIIYAYTSYTQTYTSPYIICAYDVYTSQDIYVANVYVTYTTGNVGDIYVANMMYIRIYDICDMIYGDVFVAYMMHIRMTDIPRELSANESENLRI